MVATAGHQLQIVLEREQLTADLALVFGMPRIICTAGVMPTFFGVTTAISS
jgi:hypothetical protein